MMRREKELGAADEAQPSGEIASDTADGMTLSRKSVTRPFPYSCYGARLIIIH